MRFIGVLFCVALFFVLPALGFEDPFTPPAGISGVPSAKGEVLPQPICFNVVNKAPYTVFGNIFTNYYTDENGSTARHQGNFRLVTGEGSQICTAGPFYDGRRVELVIRTLFPIFTCKTQINQDLVIYGEFKSEGGTKTWAGCT